MIQGLIFLAEAFLYASKGFRGTSKPTITPTAPIMAERPLGTLLYSQTIGDQQIRQVTVGEIPPSFYAGKTLAQAQGEIRQGIAIQEQVAIQYATRKTNLTSNLPAATPVQVTAPGGSRKSFL